MKSLPNCRSRLWQQANFLTNFSFLSWISSLGNENLKRSGQTLTMSIVVDLNSFITKRMTVKPSDLTSVIVGAIGHSSPYIKTGIHFFLLTSLLLLQKPIFPFVIFICHTIKGCFCFTYNYGLLDHAKRPVVDHVQIKHYFWNSILTDTTVKSF